MLSIIFPKKAYAIHYIIKEKLYIISVAQKNISLKIALFIRSVKRSYISSVFFSKRTAIRSILKEKSLLSITFLN